MMCCFFGAGILVLPSLIQHGFTGSVWKGFLILQLGSASWSLGSILQKRAGSGAHPVVSGAVQQFAAGIAFAIPMLAAGQMPRTYTLQGAAAFAYLVVFGSIAGYSAYVYALHRLPVAIVSIYTYINPIVADLLGAWFYKEPFGPTQMAAMTAIFLGVGLVKGRRTPAITPSPSPSPPAPPQSLSGS
jgi:drug/metabolite transporter (DMT)-like permease